MTDVRTCHTADLDDSTLTAARGLLYAVFDDMTEQDWEHSLGGIHALAWAEGELIGHAAVIQRRMLHAGRTLRTGYVEGVGVRADHRRQGHGAAMMDALERVIRGAYALGALGATDEASAFYRSRGWQPWQGHTSALTPEGVKRTPDEDDCVFVLAEEVPLDLTGTLTCDWRDGDVW